MIDIEDSLTIGCASIYSGSVKPEPKPEFDINDIFANGEKGGLFVYNENYYSDTYGYTKNNLDVALLTNILDKTERRNLITFSEFEHGHDSFSIHENVNFLGGWGVLNPLSFGRAYMRVPAIGLEEYSFSMLVKSKTGRELSIGSNQTNGDYCAVFDGTVVNEARASNIGNNVYLVTYTRENHRNPIDVGIMRTNQELDEEILFNHFQFEHNNRSTDYQHIANYGGWSNLALYNDQEKSIIKDGQLVNNGLVLNNFEGLESCTVIRVDKDNVHVSSYQDLAKQQIINDDFIKLFIVNRQLFPEELAGVITYLVS
jgi:hypothetical protein